jgi:DNA-binding GntR family transcriptional regulator
MIRRDTAEPPSRQLAAILRSQIESGELARGARLPSIMELANRYEIAPVTVRKALDILKREGLIHGVSGYGTFVVERK